MYRCIQFFFVYSFKCTKNVTSIKFLLNPTNICRSRLVFNSMKPIHVNDLNVKKTLEEGFESQNHLLLTSLS